MWYIEVMQHSSHPPHRPVFTGIVSLISLVILSYDRYSTLTVYNKQGPNYRRPLLAVGGSWLYSLFWTVPPLLGWSSYGIEGAGTSCSVSWTVQTAQSHAYIICLFTFCLGIPILVMVYCYGRLLLAVKQVGRRQSGIECFWLTDVANGQLTGESLVGANTACGTLVVAAVSSGWVKSSFSSSPGLRREQEIPLKKKKA